MSQLSLGRDFGQVGKIYPIIEMDLLLLIQRRVNDLLKNGGLSRWQAKQKASLKEYLRGPPGIIIPVARQNHSYYFDPSITIHGNNKEITINPLDNVNLNEQLIFIDGDDNKQINWLKTVTKAINRYKIILVHGNWYQLQNLFSSDIYFDINGKLAKRLHIHHVPLIVSQDHNQLLMKERIPWL